MHVQINLEHVPHLFVLAPNSFFMRLGIQMHILSQMWFLNFYNGRITQRSAFCFTTAPVKHKSDRVKEAIISHICGKATLTH
nr:hypothetical protein [Tanacetum cinerariifolium]